MIRADPQKNLLRSTYFNRRNCTKLNPKWRNSLVGLFSWLLVHSGAPGKQSLESPCFVSSNFSCFNLFSNCIYTNEWTKFYLSAFEVSITGVLVACAVWTFIMPSATISLPRVSSVAWAFLTSTVTLIIVFFVGLATSHVCPWAGRHGNYWLVGYRILDRLVVHRWLGAGLWRFMSGSPLPRTGWSGDSWLTPFPNLLMPDGWRTPRE